MHPVLASDILAARNGRNFIGDLQALFADRPHVSVRESGNAAIVCDTRPEGLWAVLSCTHEGWRVSEPNGVDIGDLADIGAE